jgi:uncharacterized membrane protein YbaN (DUF454 family)
MAIKKTLKYIIGWGLIVFGIMGLFLPVLQGILMILAGIAIIESEKEMKIFRKVKNYLKKKIKK